MKFPLGIEFTEKNEGYRQFCYSCSAGKNTIGIGFNLDDVGLSHEESIVILSMRLSKIDNSLHSKFDWYRLLSPVRKAALCDMAYQMGINGLLGFKKSLALMAHGQYQNAAREFCNSRWYDQTPIRADKVCGMIESGEF